MAQIQANVWSFQGTADQATTVAITSIVRNGSTALVTAAGAHGFVADQAISIQGTTVAGWTGGYKIVNVPSTTTFNINLPDYKWTLANNGANGNLYSAAYLDMIRIEQALWDKTTAATTLLITDVNGFPMWNPHCTVADQPYNYGKLYWIQGLVIVTLPSGSNLQLTIN